MKEDQPLKKLLQAHLAEAPAIDFTASVMKQVAASASRRENQRLLGLALAFGIVAAALLVISWQLPPFPVPASLTRFFSGDTGMRIIHFLLAFWVVLVSNFAIGRFFKRTIPTHA